MKYFNHLLSYLTHSTNNIELSNKVIILTGACSAIGKILAENLYKRGSRLVLIANDLNDLQHFKDYLMNLNTSGSTVSPAIVKIDLTIMSDHEECVENIIKEHKHVDMLINNSNTKFIGKVMDTSLSTDIELMSRNYFSQIEFTRVVLKHMEEKLSGHIVFISSNQGINTDPLYSSFGASQHALLAFAEILRQELVEKNIKVTTVCLPDHDTNEDRASTKIVLDVVNALETGKRDIASQQILKT